MTLQCNILYNDAAESRSVVHRILELNHNPIRLNLVNLAQPYWTFYHEVSNLWHRYSSRWGVLLEYPTTTGFQWGYLKNGPYTYTVSGGNDRVF